MIISLWYHAYYVHILHLLLMYHDDHGCHQHQWTSSQASSPALMCRAARTNIMSPKKMRAALGWQEWFTKEANKKMPDTVLVMAVMGPFRSAGPMCQTIWPSSSILSKPDPGITQTLKTKSEKVASSSSAQGSCQISGSTNPMYPTHARWLTGLLAPLPSWAYRAVNESSHIKPGVEETRETL